MLKRDITMMMFQTDSKYKHCLTSLCVGMSSRIWIVNLYSSENKKVTLPVYNHCYIFINCWKPQIKKKHTQNYYPQNMKWLLMESLPLLILLLPLSFPSDPVIERYYCSHVNETRNTCVNGCSSRLTQEMSGMDGWMAAWLLERDRQAVVIHLCQSEYVYDTDHTKTDQNQMNWLYHIKCSKQWKF